MPGMLASVCIALAAAIYGALAIRLTVRILNRQVRRPRPKIVLMALPVIYALSFGPISSLAQNGCIPKCMEIPIGSVYFPFVLLLNESPGPARQVFVWYLDLWP